MKFTIITPTYNSEGNILKTIKSIKSQKDVSYKSYFMDSNSSDNTVKLVKTNTSNQKILSKKDKGIYDALNKGIKISKEPIISILHSDDEYFSKNTLVEIKKKFFKYNINVIFGDLVYVNKNGKIIRNWKAFDKKKSNQVLTSKDFKKYIENGWMPPHPAVFIKRTLCKRIGKYDLNFDISSDYDYLIRLLKNKKLKALYINRTLIKMTIGGKSNKINNILKKMTEDLKIIKKNKIGGLKTLILKNISKINQFI